MQWNSTCYSFIETKGPNSDRNLEKVSLSDTYIGIFKNMIQNFFSAKKCVPRNYTEFGKIWIWLQIWNPQPESLSFS